MTGEALPRLVVVGAVEVAEALCRVAAAVGWRCVVVDPRPGVAVAARFPEAEEILADRLGDAFARLEPVDAATAVAVVAHDPEVDDEALAWALRSPAGYVGAIGSRRTQAERRERLVERGLTADELARMAAPIGLDLGGRTSGEMALAVLAEIVATRHGRPGGRLKDSAGPIREPGRT